jgi:hypothetical protein
MMSGARQDKLVKAKRSRINHEFKTLTIVGKPNKLRTIDLTPFDAYSLLRDLPVRLKSDFIFWHDDGQAYANVASRFRAL